MVIGTNHRIFAFGIHSFIHLIHPYTGYFPTKIPETSLLVFRESLIFGTTINPNLADEPLQNDS
ncbi:hypothetical protein ADIS_1120 [Lunatimonas lonarensis]|uniref:Uncharacterized protein n=1 Tax=Lunatimonas lonarensis TaxID=1232681 RepID=R7ZVZ4_9BACT|nr:hypothetical protein ADIS_1120 [Lunatimonas lonarensis]